MSHGKPASHFRLRCRQGIQAFLVRRRFGAGTEGPTPSRLAPELDCSGIFNLENLEVSRVVLKLVHGFVHGDVV